MKALIQLLTWQEQIVMRGLVIISTYYGNTKNIKVTLCKHHVPHKLQSEVTVVCFNYYHVNNYVKATRPSRPLKSFVLS